MKARHISHNLSVESETLSRFIYEQESLRLPNPKLGKGVGFGGIKIGAFQKCNIGFLLALYIDQHAISSRFRATQLCYRHTDGRTDGQTDIYDSKDDLDAARYRACIGRNNVDDSTARCQMGS